MPEPITTGAVKEALRVTGTAEDTKIAAMIPRARLWVEDYTGIALDQREFTESALPNLRGEIVLSMKPLVSVASVAYVDQSGAAQTYVPRTYPPSPKIVSVAGEAWPGLQDHEAFNITYTAGSVEIDDRLIGAMLALIEGEYSEGFAYPDHSVKAAERCCAFLQRMAA